MFTEFICAYEYTCMLQEAQNSCNMKSNMLPYTHNCNVSKRNPDFQIALLPIIVSDKTNHSHHLAILIHATFSKVNFASNNRQTHHNISLSKQPNQNHLWQPRRNGRCLFPRRFHQQAAGDVAEDRIAFRGRKIVGRATWATSPVRSRGPSLHLYGWNNTSCPIVGWHNSVYIAYLEEGNAQMHPFWHLFFLGCWWCLGSLPLLFLTNISWKRIPIPRL